MAAKNFHPGKMLILLVCVVLLLGFGTVALVSHSLVPQPYACKTQTLKAGQKLAGARFTVTQTDCKDYAHKKFVSVYVQRIVPPGAPFFKHWFNQKTLIFRYHPERASDPPPVISQADKKAVKISVPRVLLIDRQRHQWLDMSIQYNIGHIVHPYQPNNYREPTLPNSSSTAHTAGKRTAPATAH